MADRSNLTVCGFRFGTAQDAEAAKNEQARIERIEQKMDYGNPEMVNAVYQKAIDKRTFKTPVGYNYLKKLQNILKDDFGMGEAVVDIPVQGVYSLRESTSPAVERIKVSTAKPKPAKRTIGLRASLFVNIVLLLLVAVMFYISMTGSNPTVLNYEHAIQDKYSQWEQELSERESLIRERERELLLMEED